MKGPSRNVASFTFRHSSNQLRWPDSLQEGTCDDYVLVFGFPSVDNETGYKCYITLRTSIRFWNLIAVKLDSKRSKSPLRAKLLFLDVCGGEHGLPAQVRHI